MSVSNIVICVVLVVATLALLKHLKKRSAKINRLVAEICVFDVLLNTYTDRARMEAHVSPTEESTYRYMALMDLQVMGRDLSTRYQDVDNSLAELKVIRDDVDKLIRHIPGLPRPYLNSIEGVSRCLNLPYLP